MSRFDNIDTGPARPATRTGNSLSANSDGQSGARVFCKVVWAILICFVAYNFFDLLRSFGKATNPAELTAIACQGLFLIVGGFVIAYAVDRLAS